MPAPSTCARTCNNVVLMVRRKFSKAKLAHELRDLQMQCIVSAGRGSSRLTDIDDHLDVPPMPELHVVFQPLLTVEEKIFVLDPENRCVHSFGGKDGRPVDPEPGVLPLSWKMLTRLY